MFYIHGGAYSHGSGSSPLYDGTRLCRRGEVVVVTVNHRLNAFGYAYLARLVPELADSGNAGGITATIGDRTVRFSPASIRRRSRASPFTSNSSPSSCGTTV